MSAIKILYDQTRERNFFITNTYICACMCAVYLCMRLGTHNYIRFSFLNCIFKFVLHQLMYNYDILHFNIK